MVHHRSGRDSLAGSRRRPVVQRALFSLAFVVLVGGTVAGAATARHEAHENAERRNAVAARQGVVTLERLVDDAVRVLGGSAAIVDDDGELQVDVFDAIADDAMSLGELWGVALVGVVADIDRPGFEARMGAPIRTLVGDELTVAPAGATYYPVLGVRPDVTGPSIVGFDFASDAVRADALRRAAASGRVAVSGPTILSGDGVEGVALVRPLVHDAGGGRQVRGFVAAGEPLQRLSERVADAISGSMTFAILRDGVLVTGDAGAAENPGTVRTAQVADETWEVAVRPLHGPDLALAWLVGGVGAAATVAMAALLAATQRHQRAMATHTEQLATSERRRRAERDLAGELALALTADQVTATLLQHLPTAVGAQRAALSLRDDEGQLVLHDHSGASGPLLPGDTSWMARTVQSGDPAWLDSPQDWRHDPVTASVAGDARSLALVPFHAEDIAGVLVVSYGRYHILSDEERSTLQTVALLAGRALARGRRYDSDHHAAVEFQRAALPTGTPELDTVRLAARYRPAARGAPVGGDWYDAVVLPDRRVLLVVGDVVGHGMAAAATMGRLRTAFHVLATSNPDPGALLEAMNAQVESIPDAFCTTVVCALIDPVRATLRWARAGHLPPLLVGADGAELLDQPGMPPLGVIDGVRAPVHDRVLRDDDLILLYTDGIIERRDEAIDTGLERLQAVATHLADLCPADFCDALIQALVPEQSQRDDIAALVVRLDPCIDITADGSRTGNGGGVRYRGPRPARGDVVQSGEELVGGEQMAANETSFAATLEGSTGQGQIGHARNRFTRWLEQTGIDTETVDEMTIVFSELAANAVAASPAGTSAQLRAHCDTTAIVLEAVNGSPQTNALDSGTWDLNDPLRPGGRGLLIVKAYMDNVQIEPADDANGTGILVRCRRDLVSAWSPSTSTSTQPHRRGRAGVFGAEVPPP